MCRMLEKEMRAGGGEGQGEAVATGPRETGRDSGRGGAGRAHIKDGRLAASDVVAHDVIVCNASYVVTHNLMSVHIM